MWLHQLLVCVCLLSTTYQWTWLKHGTWNRPENRLANRLSQLFRKSCYECSLILAQGIITLTMPLFITCCYFSNAQYYTLPLKLAFIFCSNQQQMAYHIRLTSGQKDYIIPCVVLNKAALIKESFSKELTQSICKPAFQSVLHFSHVHQKSANWFLGNFYW